ncbi:hypothetical protein SLA2020_015660 [Shorea laevis]
MEEQKLKNKPALCAPKGSERQALFRREGNQRTPAHACQSSSERAIVAGASELTVLSVSMSFYVPSFLHRKVKTSHNLFYVLNLKRHQKIPFQCIEFLFDPLSAPRTVRQLRAEFLILTEFQTSSKDFFFSVLKVFLTHCQPEGP